MRKVLIIEDDQDILDIVFIILTDNGYTVERLRNAADAVEITRAFLPDLILLDLNLSGMQGTHVCKSLKENMDGIKIPVILFSAVANLHNIAKTCEADDYIIKPFDLQQLLAKVKEHTGE